MSNSWGDSWGLSWLSSWGKQEEPPTPPPIYDIGDGGRYIRGRHRSAIKYDDEIILQFLEKYIDKH